mgnify:CR=1 FL=1
MDDMEETVIMIRYIFTYFFHICVNWKVMITAKRSVRKVEGLKINLPFCIRG